MQDDDRIIPGPLYINEFSTSELLEELIKRLVLTNGLEFCTPARVKYAIDLLDRIHIEPVGNYRIPTEREYMRSIPEGVVVHDDTPIVRQKDLRDPHRFDMVQGRKVDDEMHHTKYPKTLTPEADNAILMYQQIMRLAKAEGRW